MRSGKVKHYNAEKGYGFITPDKTKQQQTDDVFFHISAWQLATLPTVGMTVYYELETHKGKTRAKRVAQSAVDKGLTLARDDINSNIKSRSNHHNNRHNQHHKSKRQPSTRPNSKRHKNKSPITSFIRAALILIIVLVGFAAVKSQLGGVFDSSNIDSSDFDNSNIDNSYVSTSSDVMQITGDAQIDNTIALIKQGGPYPYPEKDGTTFYNREGRLPKQSKGYYKEYTVPTPGVNHRGARRIVTGGNPPVVYYLTEDHYNSFTKLNVGAQ